MKEEERNRQIVQLWLQRPRRTNQDVAPFFAWLDSNHPNLLEYRCGDPYEWLKSLLAGYIDAQP